MPSLVFETLLREVRRISEQSSPFRRWTTGAGAGSSYRHDPRSVYTKQLSEGAAMAGQGAAKKEWYGGVARWSLGLEHLLADPIGIAAFAHFLAKEFAGENIRFWYSCESYMKNEDPDARAKLADEIWNRHLADGAPEPVNVDAAAKRATALKMEQTPPPPDVFQQAQKQIFSVMKFDSYPRFLRSPIHAECARADLCGQTPPFLAKAMVDEACPVPSSVLQKSIASEPAHDSASAKLKKSSSNASERRRSGGVSLMPWRRAGSRDRARDPPALATTPLPEHPLTDVVKATHTVPGGSTLCRVVLPDGATSVVETDADVSVGMLIDRLLSRRNLKCNAYEISIKEPKQGESRIIDSANSSSAYGGREIVVDKRCLVRIEVGGRCVMVRCKPSRRLRHIIRPVIAKYLPTEAIDKISVVQNGAVVDFDTVMERPSAKSNQWQKTSKLEPYPINIVDEVDEENLPLRELCCRPLSKSTSPPADVYTKDVDKRNPKTCSVKKMLDGKKMSVVRSSNPTDIMRLSDLETDSLNDVNIKLPWDEERANTMCRSRVSDSSSSLQSGPCGVTLVVPVTVNPIPSGMGSGSSIVTPPSEFTNNDATGCCGRISPSAINSNSSNSICASGMSSPRRSESSSTISSPINSNMSIIPPPSGFAALPGPTISVAVQTTLPTSVAVQTTMSPIRGPKPPMKEAKPSTSGLSQASSLLRQQLDQRPGVSGAKVRASLKQGPPLHQRSPTAVEGYSSGEIPEDKKPAVLKSSGVARPPPPLPPKPPRQPTLV